MEEVVAAIVKYIPQPLLESPPPSKKVRAAPLTCTTPTPVLAPPKRAEWTNEKIESMLDIRYSELCKQKFLKCKTNREKGEWWKWFAESVNIRTKSSFSVDQVRNRMNSLKTEYRALVSSINATGNEKEISYPEYWETMIQHFQVSDSIY
jgi:hypothetical protein